MTSTLSSISMSQKKAMELTASQESLISPSSSVNKKQALKLELEHYGMPTTKPSSLPPLMDGSFIMI